MLIEPLQMNADSMKCQYATNTVRSSTANRARTVFLKWTTRDATHGSNWLQLGAFEISWRLAAHSTLGSLPPERHARLFVHETTLNYNCWQLIPTVDKLNRLAQHFVANQWESGSCATHLLVAMILTLVGWIRAIICRMKHRNLPNIFHVINEPASHTNFTCCF